MTEIKFDINKYFNAKELGKAYGLNEKEIETMALAFLLDQSKNKDNQKDDKTDKQKRDEIMAIQDDRKRTDEIAKNLHLFGGTK